MPDIIDEKRRDKRLEEFHDVTLSVISKDNNHPQGKIKGKLFYNYSDDISESGVRIHTNIFLPVDTLLKMDIKLENMHQLITATGKIKWSKVVLIDKSCEAGVEFVGTPAKLEDYISWMRMLYAA